MAKIKVLLIFGGVSTEHEVSRYSASSIIKEIDDNIYDLYALEISKKNEFLLYSLEEKKEDIVSDIQKINNTLNKREIDLSINFIKTYDVIFPIIHGSGGEDGHLQGLFEISKVSYVGANVISSAIGMDKAICKVLFNNAKIPQAKYLQFTCDDTNKYIISEIEKIFTYPVFVKPACLGSSVGVTKAYNKEQLLEGIKLCKKVERKILVEEYIVGRELECAVMGDYNEVVVSNVGEVVLKSDFYSYKAKYISEEKTYIPNDIDKNTQELIKAYAIKAFKAIDCYGLARVDFFLTKDNKPILNEINTLPGFTTISMFPKLMIAYGIEYKKIITKLIEYAIDRKKKYDFVFDLEEVK